MILYHYTCEHGRRALGDAGLLLPVTQHTPSAAARIGSAKVALGIGDAEEELLPLLDLVWLTDMNVPDRDGLGMTRQDVNGCDRTRYRYRVTDTTMCRPYLDAWRGLMSRQMHLQLVGGDTLPGRWFVATCPVPVKFAPPR